MKIRLNKVTVYQVGKVVLLPGINEVSDSDAERFLANSGVKRDVSAGIIDINVPQVELPEEVTPSEEVLPSEPKTKRKKSTTDEF